MKIKPQTKLQTQNDKVTALMYLTIAAPFILSIVALLIYMSKDVTVGEAYKYAMQFTGRLRSDVEKDEEEDEDILSVAKQTIFSE